MLKESFQRSDILFVEIKPDDVKKIDTKISRDFQKIILTTILKNLSIQRNRKRKPS